MSDITNTIISIIDEKAPYRIVRRPYDKEFAKAHGITLQDIEACNVVPCLECGEDISPRVLLHQGNGKKPVYCSTKCRRMHNLHRFMKIDDGTNIEAETRFLTRKCLDVIRTDGKSSRLTKTKLGVISLLQKNNELLALILEELRNGNRKA